MNELKTLQEDSIKDIELARLFHDTYERLAPDFGYETREDTKQFDPFSNNGRLMIEVCRIVTDKSYTLGIMKGVEDFKNHLQDKANTIPPNLLLNEAVSYSHDTVAKLKQELK